MDHYFLIPPLTVEHAHMRLFIEGMSDRLASVGYIFHDIKSDSTFETNFPVLCMTYCLLTAAELNGKRERERLTG